MALLKIKLIILLFFIIKTTIVFSEDLSIKSIKIEGNQRIPTSYISSIIKNYVGKNITDEEINNITKELYLSDYFDDILVTKNETILVVKVIEKPIISDFIFKGNELLTEEQLLEIINIKKRDTFNEKKLTQAVQKIKSEYSKIGKYFTEIIVNKKKLPDSRIQLFFTINEGDLTRVKRINFSGNRFYSDDDLRGVISTKESNFYRIFGSSLFKEENIEVDKSKLRDFYKRRGYIDFQVLAYRRDLKQDYTGFNINIIVDEGVRYKLNDILINNNLSEINISNLYNNLSLEKGDYYDQRAVDESINYLNDYFGEKGYSFVEIDTGFENKENKKGLLNLVFNVKEGRKSYIRSINIDGNTRTLDHVIRRELTFLEGDPYNAQKIKQSLNALRRLGYFSLVDVRLSKTNLANEVDINIKVKEKLTGSFTVGLGYDSVEKTKFTIGLNENNFLGKGLKTRLSVATSQVSTKYNIGITEPYFQDRPLHLSGDIFDEKIEQDDKDIDKAGVEVGVGVRNRDYFNKFMYSYVESETSESTSNASTTISGEEGKAIITSSVGYSINKDTRDNFLNPRTGSKFQSSVNLAGLGGDAKFYKLESKYKKYIPYNYGDYVLSFSGQAGIINSIEDEKVTSSNRFYFNSKSVRGFDSNGIGPRDSGNLVGVGGNKYYSGSVEVRTKRFLPFEEDTGVEWSVFSDVGSLWDTDYPLNVTGHDESNPRISAGISVYWNTVVGPLNFIWGWPVSKEDYDKENNFKFSIGTSF